MRHITHCPACETQFFVSDAQLDQHDGKVRCGQCRHVFNAREQIVDTTAPDPQAEQQPAADDSDNPARPFVSNETYTIPVALDEPFQIEPAVPSPEYGLNELDDFLEQTQQKKRRKPLHRWMLVLTTVFLIFLAAIQAIYFLRNELALYYPLTKPYLSQACEILQCRIELPKKIELIMIDDSDIQEDAEHAGLIWLSSTLINQAAFTQALPNLELTLTDVEDKPKLRRVIAPAEYMPSGRDVALGLAAHEEMRIHLPIDTKNEVLAGYRVMVTY